MDYELCKKLKEAGFPMNDPYTTDFILEGEICGLPEEQHENECKDWDCKRTVEVEYPTPTLSELIEACGDKFETLIRQEGDPEWIALEFAAMEWKGVRNGKGKTPEEAVANLYLALKL